MQLVEVLLELPPFFGGDLDVFALGSECSAVVEELLVVLDDVLGEDRDVTLSGLKIQMSEQGRADVDGQAAVDDVGREESAEVVRGELGAGEGRTVPLVSLNSTRSPTLLPRATRRRGALRPDLL